jgi:hypothetical protein
MNEDEWMWMLSEFIAGRGSPESRLLVKEALSRDPRVRNMYVDLINLEEGLRLCAEGRWMERSESELSEDSIGAGRHWRRNVWVGVAAGVALGALLSVSMVWAFAGVRRDVKGLPVEVANADFESTESPHDAGVPSVIGHWGGDYSEITGKQGQVAPFSGMRMLRFLRADNRLTPSDSMPAVSEVWQWVKVERFPVHPGRRVSALELSARFNGEEDAARERVAFGVSLWAFNADVTEGPALWQEHRTLALASGSREELADRDGVSWQTVTTRLSVPAESNLVLLGLRVGRKGAGEKSPVFGAHYVDDVRLHVVETIPVEGAETVQGVK